VFAAILEEEDGLPRPRTKGLAVDMNSIMVGTIIALRAT